ncbi:hypothetical protein CBR_g4783 [Chara braunii]|uniref:Myb-like domain-containing protein n=1 Tax=Chara braunii TaxID=69332 RepID=A0A388KIU7_CHABU|nr:hypothetical protein CBR_g4783 [Chara braunii]|eukprot:GBG69956.1 hypothetical protein CBR_g4783 [Chara braunii]
MSQRSADTNISGRTPAPNYALTVGDRRRPRGFVAKSGRPFAALRSAAAIAAPRCPVAAPRGSLPRVHPWERAATSTQKKVFDEGRQDGGTTGDPPVQWGAGRREAVRGEPVDRWQAPQRVGYDALPPHLQPLPGSSDEEEEVERRPQTVSLGSGSTQEWTATELCGTGGDVYEQSFTELLRPGLGEDEGDGHVNLSFGLSTGRSTTPSRTVLVRPHPGDEGGQLTVVDRSARTRALVSETAGANQNSSTAQPRAASPSKGAQGRPEWMQLPSHLSAASEVARGRGVGVDGGTDFLDVGDGRDGRKVWRDLWRDHRLRREEYITRGVERLHVGDRENENETDDPPAEADDDDDNDVECGEGGGGHASPSLQSDMAGKGGKSKPSGHNARPRAKKGQGKGSGGEGDGDAEEKRNFWSVEHIIALIRAKRDQDAHMQGMGHAYAWMKPREWKWQDVAQRLNNVAVDRNAEKCGKKWDSLMQQFKKVHHFQSPSGSADFFQLTLKERASRGFNFTMDRAVYDEIEGSTGMNHTIHPKNAADTGREDDEEGSTRGSSQTTGTPGGSGKRKSTRQQTFEALTECMEKHGELMASTMEIASKRQCSIQVRQCEALEVEVEVQRKHYVASDEEGAASHETAQRVLAPVNRPRTPAAHVAGSSQAAVEGGTLRSPVVAARGGAVAVPGEVVEVLKEGDGAAVGEDNEALVHRLRGQRATTHAMDAAAKFWEDDNRFWNDTQGSAIVRIIQAARAYLVAVARGVQPPAIRRSISLPHNSIPQHKIEDESELNAAKERALKVQTISLRAIHGWVFKSESRQKGYHLAYQYALNHTATDIARAMWSAEDWRSLLSPMLFRTTLDVDMKLPLWFVGVNIMDRHKDDECATYQEACVQRLVRDFTSAVGTTEAMDGGRVSYERLKRMAEAMRYLLTATMWIMLMAGDDPRSHYDAWVFVQLTAKTTLLASMNRQFDARRHITQSAQVMTDKLGRPPPTFAPPPVCIPDWASKCGVTFSHDATLASPMEAKRLDWLGTGPPEDDDDDAESDDKGEGG